VELERLVREYFSSLLLPVDPTAYDYLMLSLREKDVIASFNWDPLLVHAYRRNVDFAPLPRLLFLHGNVATGYCPKHDPVYFGDAGSRCGECGAERIDTPLLFPITKKEYSSDPGIADAWALLQRALGQAFVFTIFGYSAPASDVEAVDLLSAGWGTPARRNMEEVEIIDLKSEEELHHVWDAFIHSHHYQTTNSFRDSIIGLNPRRSCEQMFAQIVEAQFIDHFPAPASATWDELYAFLEPLVAQE
jgi:hypothetical protein